MIKGCFKNIWLGLKLALLLPVHFERFACHIWTFYAGVCLYICVNVSASLYSQEPPLYFAYTAFEPLALNLSTLLLAVYFVCLFFGRPQLFWQVAVPWFFAVFWFSVANAVLLVCDSTKLVIYEHIVIYRILGSIWCFVVFFHIVHAVIPATVAKTSLHWGRQFLVVSFAVLVFSIPSRYAFSPLVSTDYEQKYEQYSEDLKEKAPPPRLNGERMLMEQYPILEGTLAGLAKNTPKKTDLYFLGFASYGAQDVFIKEASFVKKLFDQRFDTVNRSILLANHIGYYVKSPIASLLDKIQKSKGKAEKNNVDQTAKADYPLATVTNLTYSLKKISELMDKDNDMLFLFITSHGSQDHQISVNLETLPLNQLTPEELSALLAKAGIKWKIIVVSACYSGGFRVAFKDETTLLITSARDDHTSFGCGNWSDMTFFGRAYFQKALAQTPYFDDAFHIAYDVIYKWEAGLGHSDPQMYLGRQMQEKLKRFYIEKNYKK